MKTILIIEDNEHIRDNTAEILQLAKYNVLTAADGQQGVDLAVRHNPDLIVCDIMMPVLDGYGVLNILHNTPETQQIPFIFLTARTERSDFRKGMEMGADDFITKPFNGKELLAAIDSRLKKAALLRQVLPPGIIGFNSLLETVGNHHLLQSLSEGRNSNRYKKKQSIYIEGTYPHCLYYVQKGKVKTYKSNEEGKELIIGLYNAGDFLGYIAMLEGSAYKETAEAMEECELALIPRENFEELVNNNKEVAHQFIRLLAKDITEKEQQLLGLAYNSLRKKVAETIIMLKKKYKAPDGNFFNDISRENLATLAGIATESLIRTLSDFRREKLIDIERGNFTILDEKRLESLAN
ncbi:response regulator [Flavitalea flava]